jgi:kinesin family protein 11
VRPFVRKSKKVEQLGLQRYVLTPFGVDFFFISLVQMEKAMKLLGSIIKSVVREAHRFVETERKAAADAKASSSAAVDVEIKYLRGQNAALTHMLEAQRAKSERAKSDLIQQVSGLLGEFTAARDWGLTEVVEEVRHANEEREGRMSQFQEKHVASLDEMVENGATVLKAMEKRGTEGRKAREAAVKVSV